MEDPHFIDRYVKWLETLGPQGVHRIAPFVAKDVRHRTPECEGMGPDAVAGVFAKIFDGAAQVKIRVTDKAVSENGYNVYLRWDRLVIPHAGEKFTVSGVSEITIGLDGKIVSIIDYWDEMPEKRGSLFSRWLVRREG